MSGLSVERVGERQYKATNARGATVSIGYGLGQWSPGELLKIALAGCNTLSAEARLARVLGPDFQMGATVDGVYNKEENRFESLTVELLPDFKDLDEETVAAATARAHRAIDRSCTVGRSLSASVECDAIITNEG